MHKGHETSETMAVASHLLIKDVCSLDFAWEDMLAAEVNWQCPQFVLSIDTVTSINGLNAQAC